MSNTPKPQSYINVAADVNFLQRIICCNHNIANNAADTPHHEQSPRSEAKRFTFAEETPIKKTGDDDEINI